MLSSKYAPVVCIALLVALVPTIIHSYAGIVVTDGRTTAAIPMTLLSYSSAPTKRPLDWGEKHFDSHDWFEREYSFGGDRAVLTVVRSYDLKALYHHPELAVAYRSAKFDRSSIETAPERPGMPVHILRDANSSAVGMYVLQYDGRFIEEPIRFQLRTAGELLFTGRKAMTLFFLLDETAQEGASPLQLPAARLLFEAVDRFTGTTPAAVQ
jgi:hypothetical protein